MPKIILPNGNGTGPRSLKRGSDFVTMDEIVKLLGPQAQMLVEMHHRLEELEAQHGIFPAVETDQEPVSPGHCQVCRKGWDFCSCEAGPKFTWSQDQGPNLSGDMD